MKFGFAEAVLAQAVVGSDTDLDNLLPFWLAYCGIQVYPRYKQTSCHCQQSIPNFRDLSVGSIYE